MQRARASRPERFCESTRGGRSSGQRARVSCSKRRSHARLEPCPRSSSAGSFAASAAHRDGTSARAPSDSCTPSCAHRIQAAE
eukprot:6172685-Pleurochrysis_carterae.AAC.2